MAVIDVNSTAVGAGMPALVGQQTRQNQTSNTNYNNNATGNQMNQFTAGQQAMQGQVGDLYQQILSGNLQNFGLDKATRDAAWYDFQQNQLPILAAQNGVGSPALNAAAEQLNLRLAGMSGQQAVPQATTLANSMANTAYTPVGYNTSNQSNQIQNQTQNNTATTGTANVGGTLDGLSQWVARFFNF